MMKVLMRALVMAACGCTFFFSTIGECKEASAKEILSQRQLSLNDHRKIRIPQSLPLSNSFQLEVSVGDRSTRFMVWGTPEEKYFFAASNAGKKKKGYLSQKNYQFLMKKVAGIKMDRGVSPTVCPRAMMTLTLGGEKSGKSACLTLDNKTTRKMIDLSSALALLL